MQALYLLAADPVAEVTGDPNSYGFRPARSTADAIEQCFTVLRSRHLRQWIWRAISNPASTRISHDWLVAHIPMDKTILRKWLKAGFMDKHVLHPTDEGAPQGGPLSPVLANLTLMASKAAPRKRSRSSAVGTGTRQGEHGHDMRTTSSSLASRKRCWKTRSSPSWSSS